MPNFTATDFITEEDIEDVTEHVTRNLKVNQHQTVEIECLCKKKNQLIVCGSTKPCRTVDQTPTCSNMLGCIRYPDVMNFHIASSLWKVSLQDILSR